MDEKNIEVKLDNDGLTIKGEKQEDKEEKRTGYHPQERRFGSFERYFAVPEGVDTDRIEGSFKKGVLTVTLPKKPKRKSPPRRSTSRQSKAPCFRRRPGFRGPAMIIATRAIHLVEDTAAIVDDMGIINMSLKPKDVVTMTPTRRRAAV